MPTQLRAMMRRKKWLENQLANLEKESNLNASAANQFNFAAKVGRSRCSTA
jgi:hypothetical protein